MPHPQSDDSAWQACVVRDREVTGMGWIIAGQLRFMHQRRRPLRPRFVSIDAGAFAVGRRSGLLAKKDKKDLPPEPIST